MSKMQSGAIVLLLMIPFGLYAAWQVQATMRPELVSPEAPSEKGLPPKEQLTASKAKMEKWAGDVRKVGNAALQYTPGPGEATEDPDCTAAAKTIAARSKDLTDLETFLAKGNSAKTDRFRGSLAKQYEAWDKLQQKLERSAGEIEAWLGRPLSGPVDGPGGAAAAMREFETLVSNYREGSRFANTARITEWQIAARSKVIEALEAAGEKPYQEVLDLPLPLPSPKDNRAVEKALGVPAAIREQVKLLKADLARAAEEGRVLPPSVKKATEDIDRRAEEWAAKEKLLGLFADPELFTDPDKAADWIPKVQIQFTRTQTREGKDRIKKKIQEFCEAYIPRTVALDDNVLWKGGPVPRAEVRVGGPNPAKGGKLEDESLSADPAGTTEFNAVKKYPGTSAFSAHMAVFGAIDDLKPTKVSQAALEYLAARQVLAAGTGGPKWSAKSVEELKTKCEKISAEVNKLKGLGGKSQVLRLWDRLDILSKCAGEYRQLFERGP